MDLAEHPRIVPPGHRIVAQFHLWPIEVAGRYRWCEWVRIVQRLDLPDYSSIRSSYRTWVDVGYFDEVMPMKANWPDV